MSKEKTGIKITKNDWEKAIITGKSLIKQGLMTQIQGELLLKEAKEQLEKFK